MLIDCPECKLQVSDKAYSCPHCGYPMKGENKPRKERSNKRRRLPNGFGQISEIKNKNLRKPFRALITVGKNKYGRPICKPLSPQSYFETYNDAYAALVAYNRNPYDLDPGISLLELKELWFEKYSPTVNKSVSMQYDYAFSLCKDIFDMPVRNIKPRHIKGCMEKAETARLQATIKTLFNMMLDYAIEYDVIDSNCSRMFKISKEVSQGIRETKNGHISFSDEEINILWSNLDKKGVSEILIQCYSGWRPTELVQLKISDVDLEKWTFKGGIKTDAGKNRIVPIHSRIRPLVKAYYDSSDSEYLLPDHKYYDYKDTFNSVISNLGLNPAHRPHDGRKHFVTMAKRYNLDEYAIKYLVGHAITDITEKVYTDRDIEWLFEEIEKIK